MVGTKRVDCYPHMCGKSDKHWLHLPEEALQKMKATRARLHYAQTVEQFNLLMHSANEFYSSRTPKAHVTQAERSAWKWFKETYLDQRNKWGRCFFSLALAATGQGGVEGTNNWFKRFIDNLHKILSFSKAFEKSIEFILMISIACDVRYYIAQNIIFSLTHSLTLLTRPPFSERSLRAHGEKEGEF